MTGIGPHKRREVGINRRQLIIEGGIGRRPRGPWGKLKPRAAVLLGPYRLIADTLAVGSTEVEGCRAAGPTGPCGRPKPRVTVLLGSYRLIADTLAVGSTEVEGYRVAGPVGPWGRPKPKAASFGAIEVLC